MSTTTTTTTTVTTTVAVPSGNAAVTTTSAPVTARSTDADPYADPILRAYAQWVTIRINNIGNIPIKVKNLSLSWGKLYINGNKDQEVGTSTYDNQVIDPYNLLEFSSCGRSDASSGTEGNFDLVDPSDSDRQIRHFYWDCPWGSSSNSWSVSGSNSKFMVEHYGANYSGGALGTITVDVLNKPGM